MADALGTRWVTNTSAKKLLLMDEVDGMAGNEDRGGVGELIQVSHAINRESVSSTSESGFRVDSPIFPECSIKGALLRFSGLTMAPSITFWSHCLVLD